MVVITLSLCDTIINMKESTTIEDFRKILKEELVKKGVIPPEEGGDEERLLYVRWLKGKELLKQN